MAITEYSVRIEYNDHRPELWPISVFIKKRGSGEIANFHGQKLLQLMNDARNSIIAEEEKSCAETRRNNEDQ